MSSRLQVAIAASAAGAVVALLVGDLLRRVLRTENQLEHILSTIKEQEEVQLVAPPTPRSPSSLLGRSKTMDSIPIGDVRRNSFGDSPKEALDVVRHTHDAALRALNVDLMERGRERNRFRTCPTTPHHRCQISGHIRANPPQWLSRTYALLDHLKCMCHHSLQGQHMHERLGRCGVQPKPRSFVSRSQVNR